jgi:DNA-binding NtrC family response regulator
VLVVDDDANYAGLVREWLTDAGHDADVALGGARGLARIEEESYDVVLVDLSMPGIDGLSFIERLEAHPRPAVIVVSGAISIRSAVDATKLGAFDCLPKSDSLETLEALVRRAGESHRRESDLEKLTRAMEHQRSPSGEVLTRNPRLLEILDMLRDVATSNVSVLLTGESGTGKDLLARQVHRMSTRAGGPFVDVNCAALSETLLEAELFGYEKGAFTGAVATTRGLAEAADGGTLFLDEVAEMPPGLQAKLLRMTEDRTLYRVGGRQRIRLDIRIVAATNRDLPSAIAAGRVREDLYYRLAGVEIPVPPLRERREDVEVLARHFLHMATRQAGRGPTRIAPDALAALQAYRWPGNVRELRNLMERSALLVRAPVLERAHLPAELSDPRPLASATNGAAKGISLREVERLQILKVLEEEGWHQGRTAARLGLPVRTLYRRIRAYDLRRPGSAGNGEI